MFYISTRNSKKILSLKDYLLQPSNFQLDGLFLPSFVRRFGESDLAKMSQMDYSSLFSFVMSSFLESVIDQGELDLIIKETFTAKNFGNDIIKIDDSARTYVVSDLTKGPSGSYNDYSAIFLTKLLDYLCEKEKVKIKIFERNLLCNGIATLSAVSKTNNLSSIILTKLKVSDYELSLLNRYKRSNDKIFQIDGSNQFLDSFFNNIIDNSGFIESKNIYFINEINCLSILCYVPIFFYTYFKIHMKPFCVSLADDHLGFAVAAYIAKTMGLPIRKIIIGIEKNLFLHTLFKEGSAVVKNDVYDGAISTLVGSVPNNLERLLYYFYNSNQSAVKRIISELYLNNKYNLNSNILNIMTNDFFVSNSVGSFDITGEIYGLARESSTYLDPSFIIYKLAFEQASASLGGQVKNIPCVLFNIFDASCNLDFINNSVGYEVKNIVRNYDNTMINTDNFLQLKADKNLILQQLINI